MELRLRVRHADFPEILRAYAERRLGFALSRFANRIGRLTARIDDVNGPRGGIDKLCCINAKLIPTGTVVMHAVDANAVVAIDRVADRIARAVRRKLERRRDRRRRSNKLWAGGPAQTARPAQ
jgi:ribosome-associated translation inhibitor RaiA